MKSVFSQKEMDSAFRQKDASYDGTFVVAVKTTGVFCRPSCSARKPLARNVEYFPTAAQALQGGYRPCKRCRPLRTDGGHPAWVRRLLQTVGRLPAQPLRDPDLQAMGIEPARARRYFRSHYGMTFQAYARRRRLGEALCDIQRGANLAGVGTDYGYESDSGFRTAFESTFGRPPGCSRGADYAVFDMFESPVGPLVLGATPKGVCLVEFADRRALPAQLQRVQRRLGRAVVPGDNRHLKQVKRELGEYFAGSLRIFQSALDVHGTEFQQAVWRCLARIPYGTTCSYEAVALDVGRPRAQRAVGTANGSNPVAIVVPCHRVVNKNGQLGGYGGELWRKQFLLDHERAARC